MQGLTLVVASGGHSSSRCTGLSLSWPLLLWSTGSRCAGSVVVAHGPSCSAACGIFPDQGSNPCPLYWQADSQPLRHQGSPFNCLLLIFIASLHQLRYLVNCSIQVVIVLVIVSFPISEISFQDFTIEYIVCCRVLFVCLFSCFRSSFARLELPSFF